LREQGKGMGVAMVLTHGARSGLDLSVCLSVSLSLTHTHKWNK